MQEQRMINGRMETLVSVDTMRRSDAMTIAGGVPSLELMGRAAQGIFDAVVWRAPVAILAGGGNNGGDGYALACLLAAAGIQTRVYALSDKLSPDGRHYRDKALSLEVPIQPWREDIDLSAYAILVDALLGTGFQGNVRSPLREAIMAINRSGAYVVSADISSGLNGDTGQAELAVQADLTVSIGFYKLGMFRGRGPEVSGRLVNVDIGIQLAQERLDG